MYHSGLYASGSWAEFLLSSLQTKMTCINDHVQGESKNYVVPEMNESPSEHSSWIEKRALRLEP